MTKTIEVMVEGDALKVTALADRPGVFEIRHGDTRVIVNPMRAQYLGDYFEHLCAAIVQIPMVTYAEAVSPDPAEKILDWVPVGRAPDEWEGQLVWRWRPGWDACECIRWNGVVGGRFEPGLLVALEPNPPALPMTQPSPPEKTDEAR